MPILAESFFAELLVILVSITAIIVFYFKCSFNYWKRKGVETPPITFPFGNATDIFLQRTTYGEALKDLYLEMKSKGLKYCGYYMFAKPTLVVLDLEMVKDVFATAFPFFTDRALYLNEERDPLSGHLFALKGQKWKQLRAKLTPTFTSGKIKMMLQTLLDTSDELVNVMDKMMAKQEPLDIKNIVARYTTDVIGSCAFGINCNTLQNPESDFRNFGKKVIGEDHLLQHIKNIIGGSVPGLLDFLHIPLNSADVTNFFTGLVKNTINYREENNVIRKDFMHLLIQLKNNIKIRDDDEVGHLKSHQEVTQMSLTIEQIAAQALVFFIGGFETASTTLSFCLFELATNLEIQTKVRKEINDVLAKHDGKVSYEALMEMTYLENCIDETLRKYPPIPNLFRECTQPYKIPNTNVVIEKGTTVFVPILGIQHDPEYYPDPEKFDPERFSAENKAKRHHYTWLPFGEGPRICIGMRFGIMQTKIALIILLKNYTFALNSKTKVPLVMDPKAVFLSALGGIWLNVDKI